MAPIPIFGAEPTRRIMSWYQFIIETEGVHSAKYPKYYIVYSDHDIDRQNQPLTQYSLNPSSQTRFHFPISLSSSFLSCMFGFNPRPRLYGRYSGSLRRRRTTLPCIMACFGSGRRKPWVCQRVIMIDPSGWTAGRLKGKYSSSRQKKVVSPFPESKSRESWIWAVSADRTGFS